MPGKARVRGRKAGRYKGQEVGWYSGKEKGCAPMNKERGTQWELNPMWWWGRQGKVVGGEWQVRVSKPWEGKAQEGRVGRGYGKGTHTQNHTRKVGGGEHLGRGRVELHTKSPKPPPSNNKGQKGHKGTGEVGTGRQKARWQVLHSTPQGGIQWQEPTGEGKAKVGRIQINGIHNQRKQKALLVIAWWGGGVQCIGMYLHRHTPGGNVKA